MHMYMYIYICIHTHSNTTNNIVINDYMMWSQLSKADERNDQIPDHPNP